MTKVCLLPISDVLNMLRLKVTLPKARTLSVPALTREALNKQGPRNIRKILKRGMGNNMLWDMKDGLYCVMTPYLCAGFVIEHGMITSCAPILKRKLYYWITVARYVGE